METILTDSDAVNLKIKKILAPNGHDAQDGTENGHADGAPEALGPEASEAQNARDPDGKATGSAPNGRDPDIITLDKLAEDEIWLCWLQEIRSESGKSTKIPYQGHPGHYTSRAKANDPATWCTRERARAAAARLKKPLGLGGIGIMLAGFGHYGLKLVGIDLDTCRDKETGALTDWAREIIQRFGSYTEVSPSGTGVKVFFVLRHVDFTKALDAIRGPNGMRYGIKWATASNTDHPPAIELYLAQRYFAVTEQRLDDAPEELRIVDIRTVRWLINTAGPALAGNGPPSQRPTGGGPAATRQGPTSGGSTGNRNGYQDDSRSAKAIRKGKALKWSGASFEKMCAALRADPETADWVREKGEANDNRELRRIWDKIKPPLRVYSHDLPATARELRDYIAECGTVFTRGDEPVRVAAESEVPKIIGFTPHTVTNVAHQLVQPVTLETRGRKKKQPEGDTDAKRPELEERWNAITLPERVARLYLDLVGEWKLPPLDGITTAPVLRDDGTIVTTPGYDRESRLWCHSIPAMNVPARPTREQAEAALRLLRTVIRTFIGADAQLVLDPELGVNVMDQTQSPGEDESIMLAAILTAVCRAVLWLAPAFVFSAPDTSGSGTGKGLLVRLICTIAFGFAPSAFTEDDDKEELRKRIDTALMSGEPVLFLDNMNGSVLKSNTLASVITERPAQIRVLGESQMKPLSSTAFIAVTGNAMTVSEDLARKFLVCDLDARMENPESRAFKPGFLDSIRERRSELLSAALTIWRWGRQNKASLTKGRSLGSFEMWADWVRDPLLTLGCAEPAAKIDEVKENDPQRQSLTQLFNLWWERHEGDWVKIQDLDPDVVELIDPEKRSSRTIMWRLRRWVGTRAAGFVMIKDKEETAKGTFRYALQQTEAEGPAQNELALVSSEPKLVPSEQRLVPRERAPRGGEGGAWDGSVNYLKDDVFEVPL